MSSWHGQWISLHTSKKGYYRVKMNRFNRLNCRFTERCKKWRGHLRSESFEKVGDFPCGRRIVELSDKKLLDFDLRDLNVNLGAHKGCSIKIPEQSYSMRRESSNVVKLRVIVKRPLKKLKQTKLDPKVRSVMCWPTTHHPPYNFF